MTDQQNNKPTDGFLPGFEYLADDERRHMEDKRLKKLILQLMADVTDHPGVYHSPAKIATWEQKLKDLMKAREDLWKEPERDA